jgi:hypothetical protein
MAEFTFTRPGAACIYLRADLKKIQFISLEGGNLIKIGP